MRFYKIGLNPTELLQKKKTGVPGFSAWIASKVNRISWQNIVDGNLVSGGYHFFCFLFKLLSEIALKLFFFIILPTCFEN